MSANWVEAVVHAATTASVVRAVVIEARGSTPREVGAWMLISGDVSEGTIGGGALEHACMARAREMLASGDVAPWQRGIERFHLGPELNQCCGGSVTILLERFGAAEAAVLAAADDGNAFAVRPVVTGAAVAFERAAVVGLQSRAGQDWYAEFIGEWHTPLFIYGAGHVGQALVRVLEGLPFTVTWLDGERDGQRDGEIRADECDTAARAGLAPPGAFHLVMTHSHALDEEIVSAVLGVGHFGYLGLIGSATKRARFRQRLLRAGMTETLVAHIHCPIGLPGVSGKAPAVIAASVTADLLLRRQKQIDHQHLVK